ncbi:MAG: DUF4124 domain-containing protein [Burkholderiales bacterium]|nr:DUF4124 domain-containing protein [Burkholderiales bacterium]
MKAMMVFFSFGMLMAGAEAAAAVYYKCTDDKGKIEFRDTPCTGMGGVPMQLRENSITLAPPKADIEEALMTTSRIEDDSKSAANNTPATKPTAKNANERRFIRESMTSVEVYSRIGEPDSRAELPCPGVQYYLSDV